MDGFQTIMQGFFIVLILGAVGIGLWFFKKKSDEGGD